MLNFTEAAKLLPTPALVCLSNAIFASPCKLGQQDCICANKELNAEASACIVANCTIREQLVTKNITATLCNIEPGVDHSYVAPLIAFVVLAGIAVIMRFSSRVLIGASFWWDDLCNALALLCCIAFAAVALKIKDLGFGVDIWGVPPDNISLVMMGYYIEFLLYGFGRMFIRISICLFYLRIFRMSKARPWMIGTFVAMCCVPAAFIPAAAFLCTPVSYFWNQWDDEHVGRCININAMVWANSVCVIVFDLWLFCVPVPFIIRLKLSFRKKLMASVMLLTGLAVFAISIVRLRFVNQFTRPKNITRDFVGIGIWSALELDIGLVCACLPTIQVLFKYLLPSNWTKTDPDSARFGSEGRYSNSRGKSSKGSRGGLSGIRMTTTIEHQQGPTESETHLALQPLPHPGVEPELGSPKNGSVRTQAWAE